MVHITVAVGGHTTILGRKSFGTVPKAWQLQLSTAVHGLCAVTLETVHPLVGEYDGYPAPRIIPVEICDKQHDIYAGVNRLVLVPFGYCHGLHVLHGLNFLQFLYHKLFSQSPVNSRKTKLRRSAKFLGHGNISRLSRHTVIDACRSRPESNFPNLYHLQGGAWVPPGKCSFTRYGTR